MPKLIGPTSYESGDRVEIKVKYPLKNAVWKIRYVDYWGDSRERIVYSDDRANNKKEKNRLVINQSSVDELHFRLFNDRYDYNKIIVEYYQSDNKSKSAQLIIEGREKEA